MGIIETIEAIKYEEGRDAGLLVGRREGKLASALYLKKGFINQSADSGDLKPSHGNG